MGLSRTPYNKLNIHCNGVYGDKESAMDRFCKNFEKLPESVQTRLTVENDDKASMYSVKELYNGIYKRIGVPIVFDYHHHRFCNGGLTEQEALDTVMITHEGCPAPATGTLQDYDTYLRKPKDPTTGEPIISEEIEDYTEMVVQYYQDCTFTELLHDPHAKFIILDTWIAEIRMNPADYTPDYPKEHPDTWWNYQPPQAAWKCGYRKCPMTNKKSSMTCITCCLLYTSPSPRDS